MRKRKIALALLFMVTLAGNAVAEMPAPLPLPDGTPIEVEGYFSRALYNSYRHSISKDIEEASRQSLAQIRTGFFDILVDQ